MWKYWCIPAAQAKPSMKGMLNRKYPFKWPVIWLGVAAVMVLPAWGRMAAVVGVQKKSDGVILTMQSGTLRLQVWSDRIIRVTYTPGTQLPTTKSLSVIGKPAQTMWSLPQTSDVDVLKTESLQVRVDRNTGAVGFYDSNSHPILQEEADGREVPLTPGGTGVQQLFILAPDEGIYGLGQHQGGVWNYRGTTVHLQQQNMEVAVPVLVSSKGDGVLWDNPAITDVDVGESNKGILSWTSETGGAVDYYFMFGPTADGVIQDYRALTGAAPMMGRWVWGFWQCKEHYASQEELTNVVAGYRRLGVPLDGIIQDWQYWTNGTWGSHEFDRKRYPHPEEMIRALRAMHAHVMISVWPKFDLGTANFNELKRAGALYAPTLHGFVPNELDKYYDPFNPVGRLIYWQQISNDLFKLGIDAWWLDASEPELSGHWGQFRQFQTARGNGSQARLHPHAFRLRRATAKRRHHLVG